jgi:tRNA A37 threonylcarbamoyladenosine biosynthesis protein TsaE
MRVFQGILFRWILLISNLTAFGYDVNANAWISCLPNRSGIIYIELGESFGGLIPEAKMQITIERAKQTSKKMRLLHETS